MKISSRLCEVMPSHQRQLWGIYHTPGPGYSSHLVALFPAVVSSLDTYV